ncbi:MAG: hypothetical protein GKR89_10340 [Candidatus Latescibacteria bacterium]|nr:hypothetical protein [Candidatus Latescibacterota bacterium]
MGKWARLLQPEFVLLNLQAKGKFDAIRAISKVFENDPAVGPFKNFLASLIRREKNTSTAIGKGVALPHVHDDSIMRPRLAIGIFPDGVDFAAPDGELVHIIGVLATPLKHQKQHLSLLAAFSRLVQTEAVRQQLVEANSSEEVVAVFTGGR